MVAARGMIISTPATGERNMSESSTRTTTSVSKTLCIWVGSSSSSICLRTDASPDRPMVTGTTRIAAAPSRPQRSAAAPSRTMSGPWASQRAPLTLRRSTLSRARPGAASVSALMVLPTRWRPIASNVTLSSERPSASRTHSSIPEATVRTTLSTTAASTPHTASTPSNPATRAASSVSSVTSDSGLTR